MCKETLKGLSYLHTVGKMHRDIKVTTIILIFSEMNLLTLYGTVIPKLLDFFCV